MCLQTREARANAAAAAAVPGGNTDAKRREIETLTGAAHLG